MKREEITIKVEENLCKIRVGDEFPTQRNFENRSSKSMFIQRQMKIFKSLTNGVSAFDYIYGADLR